MKYLIPVIFLLGCNGSNANPTVQLKEVFVEGYYIPALSADKTVLTIGQSKSGPLRGILFHCTTEVLTSNREDKVLEVTCK